jgi:hypothetical protein
MSKYSAIREQLRVEVDKKQQGMVDTLLRDIESKKLNDEFCDAYIKLQNVGFSPYDCLIAFMKGNK